MRRIGLGAIVAAGLAAAVLDVLLCLTLMGEAMRAEGAGLLAWVAAVVLSGCFLMAAAVVLLHCAADWGWCRPGWAFGLLYLLLVAEKLGDHGGSYGSSAPLVFVCSYLTTIPFQCAVWARRTASRPPRPKRERQWQWRQWPARARRVRLVVFRAAAQRYARSVRLVRSLRSRPSVQWAVQLAERVRARLPGDTSVPRRRPTVFAEERPPVRR